MVHIGQITLKNKKESKPKEVTTTDKKKKRKIKNIKKYKYKEI